jgi:hypothetical protein
MTLKPEPTICMRYLEALNQGRLDKVLALFEADAMVASPLYGTMPAATFYTRLFKDTRRSETTLLNIFRSTHTNTSMALHFRYNWTFRNEKVVSFECVDVFETTADGNRFKKLTIIYDTAPIRADFNNRSL